jgi:hypothetical protein
LNPIVVLLFAAGKAVFNALDATVKGNPTDLENAILSIIQTGVSAYETHKGSPIDPSLIKPIQPLT